jgi:hypothetical protein
MTQRRNEQDSGGAEQTPAATDTTPEAQGTGEGGDRDRDTADHAPDPEAGIDREVGDLEDPDAEEDGALPGRVGGGLTGG